MSAESIGVAMGGKRSGNSWYVPTICHGGDGRNLQLSDGDNGKLRATCHSHHCDYKTIMQALEDAGYKEKTPFNPDQKRQFAQKKSLYEHMQDLWHELYVMLQIYDTRMTDKALNQNAAYKAQHPEFKPMPDEPWERERQAARNVISALRVIYGIT